MVPSSAVIKKINEKESSELILEVQKQTKLTNSQSLEVYYNEKKTFIIML
jgi:hypothetical protein